MATWTIIGEAGKALDATEREISTLSPVLASVAFPSCSTDAFRFTMQVDDSNAGLIPELWQSVTLKRDGTTFHFGYVTGLAPSQDTLGEQVAVSVSGPWWIAEQVALTYPKADSVGLSKDRVSAAFPEQNLKASIESVINQGAALGVPWQLGTVSSFFTFPATTLNQMSVAQALSELVRMVPDAMTWLDYSTVPPALNVTRRGVATARTITLGTDSVVRYAVNALPQQQVARVVLPYTQRATNQKRRWEEQAAGITTVGRTQYLTLSGPEMETHVPPDEPTESYMVQTIATDALQSVLNSSLIPKIPTFTRLVEEYGPSWYGPNSSSWQNVLNVGRGETITYYSQSSGGTGQQFVAYAPKFLDNRGVPVSGHFIYDVAGIPDWVLSRLGGTKVSYDFVVYVVMRWSSSAYPEGMPTTPGLREYATTAAFQDNYFTHGAPRDRITILWTFHQGEGLVIPNAYPAGATFYKPALYNFPAPPANFAANLLAAQNWLPHEGSITLQGDDVGDTRYRGCKVNLAGGRVATHATMGALVESEELDLKSGQTTIHLGAPGRINYRNLVDRLRRTPQNNVIPANT